jgi:hypothetical protein
LLEQSADQERFTLGSSLDNEVVLEHPMPADEERCYINLVHAQLYPDPDRDSLILFNNSTSAFNVQPLGIQVQNRILPSQEARLERGSWRLSLGEGLDFEIKILPLAAREVPRSWSLISSTPATSSLAVKQPGKVVAIAQTKDEAATVAPTKDKAYQSPSLGTAKSVPASTRKKIVEAATVAPTKHKAYQSPLLGTAKSVPASTRKKIVEASGVRDSAILRPCNAELSIPSSMSKPHASDEVLCDNDYSLVFKAIRKRATVAIKVFRHPKGVKVAADMWREELGILNDLNHVSTPQWNFR